MLTIVLEPTPHGYAQFDERESPHHQFASAVGLAAEGVVGAVGAMGLTPLLPYTLDSLLERVVLTIDAAVHGHALRHMARCYRLREGKRQGIAHVW